MSLYRSQLEAAKDAYPFQRWVEIGVPPYTRQACAAFAEVFDRLIASLAAEGEDAPLDEKLECFRKAVLALNTLNEKNDNMIEADEREDLCELCNVIARAAGLDPTQYGGGEGIAAEWREW